MVRRHGPAGMASRSERTPREQADRIDVSDIFDEVEEDLRADRARHLVQRYGGLLILAAVMVVLAVAGYQAWKYFAVREVSRVATLYIDAARLADAPGGDHAAAATALAQVATEGSAGYRTLARLRLAALKADAGDSAAALSLWDQISTDGAADPILRSLANLQWATHQIDAGDPAAVAARLKPLAQPNSPYHALAQEAQGMLAMRQGHADEARQILRTLAQDVTAPDGVRARANGLLAQLGFADGT